MYPQQSLTWDQILTGSWEGVVVRFVNFLPNLLTALVILIIGWVIAGIIARLVDWILRALKIQDLFEGAKIEDVLRRGGVKKDATSLLATLVKWILILVVFVAAFETLQLDSVVGFLNKILAYAPNVIAAAAILLIGVVASHFLQNVVHHSLKAGGFEKHGMIEGAVKWSITIFAIIAALGQLGIGGRFLETLFTGIVAMLALAGGLAFGLGSKDEAKKILDGLKNEAKK